MPKPQGGVQRAQMIQQQSKQHIPSMHQVSETGRRWQSRAAAQPGSAHLCLKPRRTPVREQTASSAASYSGEANWGRLCCSTHSRLQGRQRQVVEPMVRRWWFLRHVATALQLTYAMHAATCACLHIHMLPQLHAATRACQTAVARTACPPDMGRRLEGSAPIDACATAQGRPRQHGHGACQQGSEVQGWGGAYQVA